MRPARAGAKRNPSRVTAACRSVLAGRPGQRRCRPSTYRCPTLLALSHDISDVPSGMNALHGKRRYVSFVKGGVLKKLDNIHAVSEAEILLIQKQSALLLQQRQDGFNGEMKTAGAIVENFVKGLLGDHLPHGYRICSGYIATSATLQGEDNLIQHDIIVVDDRVPSLYKFGVSDIEVVPAEAVCAVVEVKRTLTKQTFSAALDSLRATKQILDGYDNGLKSKDKPMNNACGVTLSVATHAPIYAIVALDALKEVGDIDFLQSTVTPAILEFLDLVWAPSAPFLAGLQWEARSGTGPKVLPLNTARNNDSYRAAFFAELAFSAADSARLYRNAIFLFRTWINHTSGAPMTIEKNSRYFSLMQ